MTLDEIKNLQNLLEAEEGSAKEVVKTLDKLDTILDKTHKSLKKLLEKYDG